MAQRLGRQRARLREHLLIGAGGQGPRARTDSATLARDLRIRRACDLLRVLIRAPARERQVCVAVDKARQHGAAARVQADAARVRLEAHDALAVEHQITRLEQQFGGPRLWQPLEAVIGQSQDLGSAGQGQRCAHSSAPIARSAAPRIAAESTNPATVASSGAGLRSGPGRGSISAATAAVPGAG